MEDCETECVRTLELNQACRILHAAVHGTGFQAFQFDVEKRVRQLAQDMPNFGLSGSQFASWCEVADHLVSQSHKCNDNGVWGWKEPNSRMFLPNLKEVFPNMKYVHVIRDGVYMSRSTNRNQLIQWIDWFPQI